MPIDLTPNLPVSQAQDMAWIEPPRRAHVRQAPASAPCPLGMVEARALGMRAQRAAAYMEMAFEAGDLEQGVAWGWEANELFDAASLKLREAVKGLRVRGYLPPL